MEPITMAMLANGAISGAQLLAGALTKVERPTYTPASATTQAVNIAEREANATLAPGYAQAKQGIQQNMANAVNSVASNASSASDIINSVGSAQTRANLSMSDLVRANLQSRMQRRGIHLQTLGNLAREQNQAWQINEQQPFLDSAATASGLMGAGLTGLTSTISDYAAYKQMQPSKPKEYISLPAAPPSIGFQDMVSNGSQMSWQNIINSLNR